MAKAARCSNSGPPEDQPNSTKGFTMSDDTRQPEENEAKAPKKPRLRRPWPRRILIGAGVGTVVLAAVTYPAAAVPIGLGLTALQLIRQK